MASWKTIPGFPSYEASDEGQIRRIAGGPGARVGYVLTASEDGRGYLRVTLRESGVQTTARVHVLVAAAFHGPRPANFDVSHLDGNRLGNGAANLAYENRATNLGRRSNHGTLPVGEAVHNARLSSTAVRQIHARIKAGEGHSSIAATYGVTKQAISKVSTGMSWGHVAAEVSQ